MNWRRWVSWSVRGLGGVEKRRSVKDVIRRCNPEVIILQETKLDNSRLKEIQSFSKSLNCKFDFIPATGSTGGLLTLWKGNILTVEHVIKEERFLGLIMRLGNEILLLGNAYGPNLDAEKENFFSTLSNKLRNFNCCLLVGGDFNSILSIGERSSLSGDVDAVFNNFVAMNNLIDLPLQDSNFTCYSSRNGGV
ncbi:uncharacterized protein LOC130743833 [Lotus japonicus]|uniref:uncharacterized protein LOC130743833 n=1 Tax=Lotus japonicus TaxID=34305 RepID=UPI0025869DB8|nr:uncharacterized protein LOC130743833 [Lotus japonicus]